MISSKHVIHLPKTLSCLEGSITSDISLVQLDPGAWDGRQILESGRDAVLFLLPALGENIVAKVGNVENMEGIAQEHVYQKLGTALPVYAFVENASANEGAENSIPAEVVGEVKERIESGLFAAVVSKVRLKRSML